MIMRKFEVFYTEIKKLEKVEIPLEHIIVGFDSGFIVHMKEIGRYKKE